MAMKHPLLLLLILLGSQLFFSCSQTQSQKETDQPQSAKADIPPPLYLGTVHQVFPSDNFALIRIIGPRPGEGTVLVTHPEDGSTSRVGNLVVSSAMHARNSIIAADIRAGVVMRGDRVYKYRSISTAPAEEETPTLEPEELTLSGEEIDLGYMPPEVRARRERNARLAAEAAAQPAPAPDEVISQSESPLPAEDDDDAGDAPMPDIPTPTGMPGLDEIPDTISGWDSM